MNKCNLLLLALLLFASCAQKEKPKVSEEVPVEKPKALLIDTIAGLGAVQVRAYSGLMPQHDSLEFSCRLKVISQEHSGDGRFELRYSGMEYTDDTEALYILNYTGKRYTLRGMPGNKNATIWQFVAENADTTFNFLYENDSTLTQLEGNFKKSTLKYNRTIKLQKIIK